MRKSFLLIMASALMLTSCGGGSDTQKEVKEKVENVMVQSLTPIKINRIMEYSTTLEGYEEVNISPSVQGNIEHIYVEPGARVSQGQLLVRMDQTQLNAAKVQKNTLSVELARSEALLKIGSLAQSVFDQLKAQYDVATSNLAFLEKNTFVKAPFSGVIAAKNYENGEMYSPAMPILKLSQISRLKAHVNISESYFPVVKNNMSIEIASDIYPGESFKGRIETIYPTIDPTTHTFRVKIDIPNASQKLRPGMFARATLSLGEADAVVVPYNSVIKMQGSNERYVFVKRGDVAKRINVELGQRFDDQTEIISPEITKDDQIIVVGQARLVDGVRVKISEPTAVAAASEAKNDSTNKK